ISGVAVGRRRARRITLLVRTHEAVPARGLAAPAVEAAHLSRRATARRAGITDLEGGLDDAVPAHGAPVEPADAGHLADADLVPPAAAAVRIRPADAHHAGDLTHGVAHRRPGRTLVVRAGGERLGRERLVHVHREGLDHACESGAARLRRTVPPGQRPPAPPV